MKHARQVIREAVETSLSAITGVTLHRSRAYPIHDRPAISIFGNDEESDLELGNMPSPIRYTRQMALNIEICVDGTADYDDLVDDYAAQVETIMDADNTLGGTCTESKLRRSVGQLDGEGEKAIAKLRLTYEVWYRTIGGDPENAITS